jgi:tetratricopeptide (TPR) repeat protein
MNIQQLGFSPNHLPIIYLELANSYRVQRQYDKAQRYLEQTLELSKRINLPKFEVFTMVELGEIFREQKQYGKALQYFEKALTVMSNLSKPPVLFGQGMDVFKLIALEGLGKTYLELKQYDKAQMYLENAYSLLQSAAPPPDEDSILLNTSLLSDMIELYQRLGIPQLAILYAKQEINFYIKILTEIKRFDKNTQREYLKSKEPFYRRLSDLLISQGRLSEAQDVLDLLKEEEEFDKRKTLISGETPDTLPYNQAEAKVIAKIETLAALGRRQAELQNEKEQLGDKFPAKKQRELDKIFTGIEAANKAFRESLDALAKAERSVESQAAEIQSEKNLQRRLSQFGKELKRGAAAIYTVIGTEEKKDSSVKAAANKTR